MGTKRGLRITMSIFLCVVLAGGLTPTRAGTIYVDDDAPALGDGSSWGRAFQDLQEALAVAQSGDEIRVAQGLYHAAYPVPGVSTPQDVEATFRLVDGVAIVGGYAGPRGPNPDLRNPALYLTTLSGDLGGNDNDPNNKNRWLDNTKHIITAKDVGAGTVLDGLIIAHGYADDEHDAALYNEGGSLVLRDCTFRDNGADNGNAGVYNLKGNLQIEHCRFLQNWADDHSASLCNDQGSVQVIASEFVGNDGDDATPGVHNLLGQAVLFACLFRANHTDDGQGAVWNQGDMSLLYCTFVDNDGGEDVGALTCLGGHVEIAHCLFSGNRGEIAGALWVARGSVSLKQCTFYGNVGIEDDQPGAIYGPYRLRSTSDLASSLTANGCIFWANRAEENNRVARTGYYAQIRSDPDLVTVEYCCIEGWTPQRGGIGNIGTDPLFVAPDQNDFHLKSQAGHWDAMALAWVLDEVTSPCIDAGDPNSPIGQEPFPNGGRVNMGAYGGTCEASKSWFGAEPGPGIDAADLNGDGQVDAEDYRLALQRWPQADQ